MYGYSRASLTYAVAPIVSMTVATNALNVMHDIITWYNIKCIKILLQKIKHFQYDYKNQFLPLNRKEKLSADFQQKCTFLNLKSINFTQKCIFAGF